MEVRFQSLGTRVLQTKELAIVKYKVPLWIASHLTILTHLTKGHSSQKETSVLQLIFTSMLSVNDTCIKVFVI